jgi:hypothetical protein
MANRSNRRRQNPRMSKCEKHEKAIGSRRANSPSWPCIETMPYLEAEYTCAVGTGAKATGLAMRRSPYTDIRVCTKSTLVDIAVCEQRLTATRPLSRLRVKPKDAQLMVAATGPRVPHVPCDSLISRRQLSTVKPPLFLCVDCDLVKPEAPIGFPCPLCG